ncbi:ankyrin repeat domain-containing protein [Aliivibrio kagoshimensis]|uniref:ankyrin repeat domain-containing protein n=1 Tax=Aliivibrio kagoshimensis TaxID=2910230 RepID=UPI003D125C69
MLKILSTVALLVTIFVITPVSAKTTNELIKSLEQSLQAGDNSTAIETADALIDKLIDEKQFKTAYQLSDKFAQASTPDVAKFGLIKLSSVFKALYDTKGDKGFLVSAGASLIQMSKDEEVLTVLSYYAKEYDENNPKEYFQRVKAKAHTMETDKVLRAAFSHIKYDRWELVKMYIKEKVISASSQLSRDGTSLLHMAIWYNKPDVVKALIEQYNADVNLKDKEGDTPLKYAQHQKFTSLANYIKSQGGTL